MANQTGAENGRPTVQSDGERTGFVRGLSLLDGTMLVAGNMIGSGIFIVSADIARQVGSPGWLLAVWLMTGVLTLIAAMSYGELAAMFPHAGAAAVARDDHRAGHPAPGAAHRRGR